jgi:VCBS repeat-containing protein
VDVPQPPHPQPALFVGADKGALIEDNNVSAGRISTSGTLKVLDPDLGQGHLQAQKNSQGTYGVFSMDANGHWTYFATNSDSAVQALKTGDALSDRFTVTSADGTQHTVNVTIQGTNDAPTLTAQSHSVVEDGARVAGQMAADDIDRGDSKTFSIAAPVAGLTFQTDGSYTFDPSDGAYQHLTAGQTQTLTVPVTVTDSAGATATQNLSITLTGTNDTPTIGGVNTAVVTEDKNVTGGRLETGGQLTITDVDTGQDHFEVQINKPGAYGTFSVDASGHWTYTADNAQTKVQSLNVGETLTDHLLVRSADGTQHTVSVTIQGTNDAPALTAQSHSVVEDGARVAGQMVAADVDKGDTRSFSISNPVAGLTFHPDGSYTFDPSDGAYQHLAAGQTQTLTVPVTVTDSAGATATQNLTISLTGTNDTPTIAGVNTAAVTEDKNVAGGRLETGGQLTITDVDTNQDHFEVQINKPGAYGTFSVDASGHWTYTADNAQTKVQSLNAGEALTDHLLVRSADGTQHTVSVTIQGTNDAPTLTAQTPAVIEDGARLTGQMVAQDADAHDVHTFSIGSPVPGLNFSSDGRYVFDPADSSYQLLAAGQTQTLIIPVTVTDGAGATAMQNLSITVTGANDGAVIAGVSHGLTFEDSANLVNGKLTVQDVDTGEAAFQPYSGIGVYGIFGLKDDGTWSYQINNSKPEVQALAAGQTATETFTVHSIDGTSQQVTVTIEGKNDTAVIGGVNSGQVKEDTTLRTNGRLTISDADSGQAAFRPGNVAGTYGTLHLTADGQWTYDLNNNARGVQSLAKDGLVTDTLTVTSVDGTTHQVKIAVSGTNDVPVISGTSTGNLAEDNSRHSVTQVLRSTDVDAGDTATWTLLGTGQGTYGQLNFDPGTQRWTYTLDNTDVATNALSAGQHVSEIFQVRVTDSNGATATKDIRVNITGSNDAPTITGTATGTVVESDPSHATVGGTLAHADVDTGDTFHWTLANGHGIYGNLHFDTVSGDWLYSLDESKSATQALNAGQTVTETFTVTGQDKAGARVTQSIKVQVQGSNDNPVISGAHEGAVVEDRTVVANGALTSADVDAGDKAASWQVLSPHGTYGSLNIDGSGRWTYNLDPASSQSIKAGTTVDESFVVKVTDQHGGTSEQTVTLHVTGSNDAPNISASQSSLQGEVTEDRMGFTSTGGTIGSGDPDVGDRLSWSIAGGSASSLDGRYGTFSLGADGHWTYTLNHGKANGLAEGSTATETFNVHVTDGAGQRSSAVVTVRIHGSNDSPAIGGQTTGDVTEDVAPTARGALLSGDPDHPDSAQWEVVGNGLGQYGSLALDQAGHWIYSLDQGPNVQALGAGESVIETFGVKVTDSQGAESTQQITVHVRGDNDAPTITGTTTGQVAEDVLNTVSGQLAAQDVDRGDHAHFQTATFNGNYGQLSIDAAGQWTYAMFPTDPHVQALAEGQRIVENFNVAAVDEHGGTTYQPLTVILVGTNDAPAISGVTTGVVLPNAVNTAQGHLTALDPDAGDSANWSLTDGHGRYGDLVLSSDGSWTYQLDLSRPETQSLQVGQQVSERFEVLVTDASGAKDARQVNVTVLGAQTATTTNTGHPGTSGGQGNPSSTNPHPVTGTQSGTPGPIVVPPITVSVTEDVILQQSGPIPRVAATGEHFSWQVSPVTGVFGTLTLDASGRWQYQLHDTAPQVQALSAGQTAHEYFTVVGHDSHGGEVRTQVAVEVHGTDDKPIISGVDTGVAVEDVREDVSGKLAVVDVDAGDTASWQALDSQGRFGSFSVDSDGVWHYHLDPALAQGLNAGETRTEVFRVQATDKSGALSDPHEVTVQIQGTTDGPMLQGVHAGPASLAQPAVAGVMPVLDPDINDQHVFGLHSPAKGEYGTLTLAPDGHYQYQLDPASPKHIALPAGGQATDTFTIQVMDKGGHLSTGQLVVDIRGTNDAPIISGAMGTVVTEDSSPQSHGQLSLSDPDTGDKVTLASHDHTGQYGVFHIQDDGVWNYTLDNKNPAVQSLGAGQTLTERIPISIHDSQGLKASQEMLVTIRGTNDVPVVTGDVTGAVGEDGATQRAEGHLKTTDLDTTDHTTWTAMSTPGTYGAFVLGADGGWHYQLNNTSAAVQALADGQVVWEKFIAHGTDGHGGDVTQVVEVKVTGANDAAIITGQLTGAVTEDHAGGLLTSGKLLLSDMDSGQGHLAAQSVNGQYGRLDLHTDGTWAYTGNNADPAVQALGAGKTMTDVITVTAPDGTHKAITITFTGVNDRAVIAGVSTASVTEDVGVSAGSRIEASGQLTVNDVDNGESHFNAQSQVTRTYGAFSIDPTGHWTYTADNTQTAVQQLKAGDTLTDTFTVSSADGTSHTIAVTLKGSNDAPVLTAQTQSVDEDGASLTGRMNATDLDAADKLTFSTTAATPGFTLNTDGSYSFDPSDNAYQHLSAGQTQDVTIPITVTDSAGATSTQNLVVTVTGKNDGAVITGVDTGVVTEDSGVTGSTIQTAGQLTITDRDVGEDHFAAQSGAVSTYGTFSVDEKGHWSYVADNKQTAIQQLKAGDTLTDSFTVSSADGTSHMITVTLKGSNDSPVLTAQSQSVNEDGARLSGHMNATDVDAGDRLTFSAAAVTPGFTLGTDGSYSFDPKNSAYQHLVSGQTQDVIIPITVTDSAGASSTQNLVVTVTGKNDGAVIRGVDTGLVMEDSGVLGSMIQTAGRLTIADRDAGEDHFTEQSGAVGAHGTFSIDPTGHWTYAADNTQAAVQQLKASDTLTDSFTVSSADGTNHTITVTLKGSNDSPVLTAQSQSVNEDGARLSGHMNATDVDAADKLTFSTAAATPGFTLNTDGSYSFDPSDNAYQHLGAGQTQDVTIPITVTDSAGATATKNLVVTVTGENDGAIIAGQTHGAVTEDQAMQGDKLFASGNLTINDSDTGESCFVAQQDLQGQYGSLSIDEFGAWKYVADNNQSAVQGLNLGQTLTETFTVHSIDGAQQVISITVNGADEALSRKAGLDEQHFEPTPSLSNQPDSSPVVVTVSIDQDLPPSLTLPVKQLVVAPPEHHSVDSPTLEPPLAPALVQPEPQIQPQPTVHVEEPMLEPPLPPALVQPEPQSQPQPQPAVHVEDPVLEPPLPPVLVQPEPQTQPQPTVHVDEPMLEPPLPSALVQPEHQPQPTVHVEEPMLEPPLHPALDVQPETQPQPQPEPTIHVEEPTLEPPLPATLVPPEPQPQPQPMMHVEEPILEPPLPPAHVLAEPQPQPQPLVHVEDPVLEPPLPPVLMQPEPLVQQQPMVHVDEPVLEPPLPSAHVQPEPQTQPQPAVHVEEPVLEPPLPPALVQPA